MPSKVIFKTVTKFETPVGVALPVLMSVPIDMLRCMPARGVEEERGGERGGEGGREGGGEVGGAGEGGGGRGEGRGGDCGGWCDVFDFCKYTHMLVIIFI